jgi:protein-L-isoaspartate(D-aspartate) O-methyltransferase
MRKNGVVPVIALCVLRGAAAAAAGAVGDAETRWARQRETMVRTQIEARGVTDPRVLAAMRKVPRHRFVPTSHRRLAYADMPLPIGEGQTISQPYIVAAMTEALALQPEERVLEIGTGSGYQAAVLAELVREVCTIEIMPALARRARDTLAALGCTNVCTRVGDGRQGWPEKAPFDAVIVTCAPESIPAPLVEQLREGGRIVIPVGERDSIQKLVRGVKRQGRLETATVMDVRFVPMLREPSRR